MVMYIGESYEVLGTEMFAMDMKVGCRTEVLS